MEGKTFLEMKLIHSIHSFRLVFSFFYLFIFYKPSVCKSEAETKRGNTFPSSNLKRETSFAILARTLGRGYSISCAARVSPGLQERTAIFGVF